MPWPCTRFPFGGRLSMDWLLGLLENGRMDGRSRSYALWYTHSFRPHRWTVISLRDFYT